MKFYLAFYLFMGITLAVGFAHGGSGAAIDRCEARGVYTPAQCEKIVLRSIFPSSN